MHNRIFTNSIRNIKKSLSRFISLLIMSFLGVFVYSGLHATAPDMINSLDKYLKKYNTYDISITSRTGFSDEDINKISHIKKIDKVVGINSFDALVKKKSRESVLNISSFNNDINKLEVINGRLPINIDEIVVESNFIKKNKLKINNYININNKKYKIVGIVSSSLYFNNVRANQNRGYTNIGTGIINYYAFVNNKLFTNVNYSKLYITLKNKYKTSSKEYLDEVKNVKNSIKNKEWNINERVDYSAYSEYIDDTNSIKNLSLIFPAVFFAVAILVSLISMNRMVEEDRGEIGTLKSLGFSNKQIIFKYLLFSLIATIIGGVIGSLLGIIIIPNMIFNIYKILFDIPKFYISLNLLTNIIGIIISVLCICGTTYYTVIKELKEKPSNLMRPKAPKNGKRVLLENISFIWNKLNFSNKITIRNLFRYKKRVIVTIIGISGCTALMLCGFGIKDSIVDIPKKQYGEIFKFDGMAYITNYSNIFNDKQITNKTYIENIKGKIGDYNINIFIAPNDKQIKKIINFNNDINLINNKVIITEKLASLKNYKIGDVIKFNDINGNKYEYKISGITNNYIDHYIFMNKDTFGFEFRPNIVYFNTKKNIQEDKLSKHILNSNNVITVSYVSSLITKVENMLKSLDKVVIILIFLSALLSFVVLYNLSNININERKREIATLKVLGFYNNEVDKYITKENIILTIIGIIIGLIIGTFLTNYVVSTVEIEKARFIRNIKLNSYINVTLISLLFTFIVNFVTHFMLKKIDMIESLKSVE